MDLAKLGYSVDTSGLVRGEKALNRMDAAGSRVEKGSKSLGAAFGGLGRILAGVGFGALAVDTFKSSESMESMSASLKTVTGSAQAADKALTVIKEFAKTTPFALEQSVQAFVKLKALGLDPSIESLRSYGNTAAAMGKSLNQAIEAVADAATGEFERLKEFGIKAKSEGDNVTFTFQGVATTVRKNASDIEGYLRGIGDVNFAGAMSDQMDTLSGVSSNMKDSFFNLQVQFFKTSGAGDAMKSIMLSLSGAFSNLTAVLAGEKESGLLSGLAFVFGELKGIFSDTSTLVGEVITKSESLNSIFSVLGGVFTNTRIVGISFVEGMLVGFENIKYGVSVVIETIKGGFKIAFDAVISEIARPIDFLRDGLATVGLDSAAEMLGGFRTSLFGTETAAEDLRKKLAELKAQKDANILVTRTITSEMVDFELSQRSAAIESKKLNVTAEDLPKTFKQIAETCNASNKELKDFEKYLNEAEAAARALDQATGRDLLRSQSELNNALDQGKEYAKNYAKALEQAKAVLFERGVIAGTKEYQAALESLGFQSDRVNDKQKDLGTTVTTVRGLWERANDSMFDSLKTFYSSGLKDTKSFAESFKDTFKDMIASVLAEITRLIASNAFKKFLNFASGGSLGGGGAGIFDGLGAMFGAGGGGDKPDASSLLNSAGTIKTLLSGMGGGASGTSGIAGIGRLLFGGGNVSAAGPVVPTTGLFGGAGAAIAEAAGALKAGATQLLGVIPGWGQVALAALAVRALIGSGARSAQQIGLDQLQSVDDATKAGRNNQVENLRGSGVSFLGGFNEASTFFGAAGVADSDLDKVGDILKQRYGFDQAFGLKDGILRLVDEDRKFSENHDQIVTEVLNSIAEVKIGFTDVERSIAKSMGATFIELDNGFDKFSASGMDSAEAVLSAVSELFGKSREESQKWIDAQGLTTDRFAEIFGAASGQVLDDVVNTFGTAEMAVVDSFGIMEAAANDSFANIGSGLAGLGEDYRRFGASAANSINSIPTAPNPETNARSERSQQPSRTEQENSKNLKTLTNIAISNSVSNQPLFGT